MEDFFDSQSARSGVKARIIAKYFDAWSTIVLPHAKGKLVYMDLYCGPGRYGDDKKSTPLMVLESAIKKPKLAETLVTIFNDEDEDAIEKLRQEVEKLPGIEKLVHKPAFVNQTIGPEHEKYFQENPIAPALTFIDPFGYSGLTRGLIQGLTKNWACDCIFFFNYARINRALGSSIFTARMQAIFGKDRAAELEKTLTRARPQQRENLIRDALTGALQEMNHDGIYVRPFRFRKGNRTTHMLVLVTKHMRGYLVANEIMGKEGFQDSRGIPFFTHHEDNEPPKNKLWYTEFDKLKEMLCEEYAGKTRTMKQIYEEHCLRKDYIAMNYKDALNELEAERRIKAHPPATARPKRKDKPTFGDDTVVTFP